MAEDPVAVNGLFEASERGGGRLRQPQAQYRARKDDVTVSARSCRELRLRGGEMVLGTARRRRGGLELDNVTSILGRAVSEHKERTAFKDLTAVQPCRQMRLESKGGPTAMRMFDLMTPVGFGTRGLIVAPPRSGKTVLIQQIASGVHANHPEVQVILLLIDERPEEVTDMLRNVPGEVVASSNDREPDEHLRLARLTIERAKRLAEAGEDILILLDSVTRLGRASNTVARRGGRVLSGGLDQGAIAEPKAIFGAARKLEEAGSVTILATALVGTESRMDDVIFSEFKGTGNMEIVLSRDLADRNIWPAVDLVESGTREERRLLSPEAMTTAKYLRRTIEDLPPREAVPMLRELIEQSDSNQTLIAALGGKA